MKTIFASFAPHPALKVVWSSRACLTVVALAVLAAPFTANAQTVRYRVVPLTEISSAQTSCVPTAINASGDVVGYCGAGELNSFAVRWHSDGTVENLGKWQNGTFTRALGINTAGQIVGDGDDGDLKAKALVRGAGVWIGIDGSGGSYQGAFGVTDDGVIFGNFSTVGSPATETWDPVFWTYDARHDRYTRNDLAKAAGTPNTGFSGGFVFAVNSLGVAVGQVASDLVGNQGGLWGNDASHSLVVLANPAGLGSAEAFGVSDDGRAVGRTYGIAASEHAVLWRNDASHTAVDLGVLAGDLRSEAYGVNIGGQVIGASFGSAAGRGFIYQNGAVAELTPLLDTPFAAWSVNEPAAINNAGVIVATATLNGVRHPVMLVPFEKVKTAQAISFTLPAGPFKFGDAPFDLTASSTSGLPIAFQASGACSVAGATVTITGTGFCQVTASQGGDADWEPAADVIQNATIGKGDATVSFGEATLTQTFDGAIKTVSTSTTPAGLTVVLSFTGSPQNAGSYPVTAAVDDLNYQGTASATLVVGKAGASITVTPYSVTYDGAAHTATAAATGVLGEDLSGFLSLAGTTHTDAGTYAADGWSFAGGANYNDASGTVSNTIAQAAQAIVFGALASRTFGDAPFAIGATGGGSGNPATFGAAGNCSVSGNTVTITGAGSCALTASQAGNLNFAAATDAAQSFAIAKAAQSIVFGAIASRTFGDAPFAIGATGGGSGNPVSFSAAGNCSVSGNTVTITGAGSCAVTASQAGNLNFAAATDVLQSFGIAKAAQSIVFGALANRTFGDAPFAISATGGGSGNPVAFGATGQCTVSGNLVTLTAAGACTITASQTGDANYLSATPVSQSFTIAPAAPAGSPLVNPGPQINQEGDQVELRLADERLRGEFSAVNLPDGVRLDKKGVIRGRVARGAAAGSPYVITVTYTAPDGASSSIAFSWTILPRDRTVTAGSANRADDDKGRDDNERGGADRR